MGARGITPDQLAVYAGALCTQEEVAKILGVTPGRISQILKKPAYREAWDRAREQTKFALRKAQLEAALVKKDRVALIWLGKNYLDQRDSPHTVEQNVNVEVRYLAEWGGGDITAKAALVDADEKYIEGEVEGDYEDGDD